VALGTIVAAAGRYGEAVRIIGKGDALLRDAGLMLDPADKAERDAAVDAAARRSARRSSMTATRPARNSILRAWVPDPTHA
jgi:hypothetical protein